MKCVGWLMWYEVILDTERNSLIWVDWSELMLWPFRGEIHVVSTLFKKIINNCDKTHIKLTILSIFKCTVQWYWVHTHTSSSPFISKLFISQNKAVFIKQQLPTFCWPQPLAATTQLSDWLLLGTSYKWNDTVFPIWGWFISCSIMFARFIHVVACGRISFWRLGSIPLCG